VQRPYNNYLYNENTHALFPSLLGSSNKASEFTAVAFSGVGAVDDIEFTTDANDVAFNHILKKAAVPVTGSTTIYLKPTADKLKQTNLTGLTFLVEKTEKTGKGKVTTSAVGAAPNYGCEITGKQAAKDNKVGSVKLTFTCRENGKKASFTAQVGNPATKVDLARASVETSSIVQTHTYTPAEDGAMTVNCTLKKDAAKTKKQEVKYTVDVDTLSRQATTDKPKIYQVKSDWSAAQDDIFKTKGKPKETVKTASFSAKLKTSGTTSTMTVAVPKGFNKTTAETGTFLIVYNNTGSKTTDPENTFGYVKITYNLCQAAQ
jgi:hypothetical protein